jgi:hypothetical protein
MEMCEVRPSLYATTTVTQLDGLKETLVAGNDDTQRLFKVGNDTVRGLGSFHKTLPHDHLGEVETKAFEELVKACSGDGRGFAAVPLGTGNAAPLTNPQGGLAADQLTHHPASYSMPPAPTVLSDNTAAEMTELYWMALLRDVPFNTFSTDSGVADAAKEMNDVFARALKESDAGKLVPGVDLPGPQSDGKPSPVTPQNLFRIGLPGEEHGPMLSQFFVRPIAYGTQSIDARQRPYREGVDYLTDFESWLLAQRSGRDRNGNAYNRANESGPEEYEPEQRYISTMRDLARFVNKDALHQAYFNAALILLSGGAKWTAGNPYGDFGVLAAREAGFGVLGGPHILALVSEVATRALKVVWNQKWQVHLRLRPEAYGGLAHVQNVGVGKEKRPYGLPAWLPKTTAAKCVLERYGGLLLPMAYTPGSPTHPAYGAGHATAAGACVTILKAYFQTIDPKTGKPIPFSTLMERDEPFGMGSQIVAWETGQDQEGRRRFRLDAKVAAKLTIEGELNKLAQNVAMGRSMGGVHWRSDNTRSLILGEAIAAEILADITTDANERPAFEFRTFGRRANGEPRSVRIAQGRIFVDGRLVDTHSSAL